MAPSLTCYSTTTKASFEGSLIPHAFSRSRDYLRRRPETAREYAQVKRDLAAQHGGLTAESREAYAEAKTSFVIRIVDEALTRS